MSLEAVLFDMDGVLIDTIEYHYLAWQNVANRLGIAFTRQDNDRLRGLSRRQSLDQVLGVKKLSEEEIQELLEYKNACFMVYLERMSRHDLLPGVLDLLRELQAAKISTGVASSSRNARMIISRLGINDLFQVICDGNDVEKSKPHPDVFLCAALKLDVRPENCIAIEDGEAGIQAGLAAGMCVLGVGQNQFIHAAHAAFPSLENVKFADLRAIYAAWDAEIGETYSVKGRE